MEAVGVTRLPTSRGEDSALIGRIQLGDGEAIELFCQEFGQAIARYSRRFANTLTLEEIEDIAQVTLIGAIEGIDRFQSNSSLKTWVLRIAHHKLVDAVRRGGSRDRRTALFLSWQNVSTVAGGDTALGGGDVIVATRPVTISFADGTVAVAQPGTELVLLIGRPGIDLRRGEVETAIGAVAAAGDDGFKFSLITRRGAYRDLGTVFRARTGADEDFLATDQGLVQAGVRTRSGDLLSADDGRSRSSDLAFTVDSVAPPLAITQRDTGPGKLGFSGRTEPGAIVTVNGQTVALGADGAFIGELVLPAGGALTAIARDSAGNQTVVVTQAR